jgi:hypothetical protein
MKMDDLGLKIEKAMKEKDFNIYRFAEYLSARS